MQTLGGLQPMDILHNIKIEEVVIRGVQPSSQNYAHLFINTAYLKSLGHCADLEAMLTSFLAKSFDNVVIPTYEIPDTFDHKETTPPSGFYLELRDYQKRTLSWMVDIETPEKIEARTLLVADDDCLIGHMSDSNYHPLFSGKLLFRKSHDDSVNGIVRPDYEDGLRTKTLEVHGGILADITGSGKTITLLSLVHTNSLKSIDQIQWPNPTWKTYMIPSRATLVVCRSNLAKQWYDEAVRCLPGASIYIVTNMNEHKKMSWAQAMTADLIIVSNQVHAFFHPNIV